MVSFQTATGTTLSLTTIASEKVLVFAKGNISGSGSVQTINLQYNGVTKDSVSVSNPDDASGNGSFTLMYTETPGAATHNVTVSGTVANVVIMVIHLKQS
jgi:hypothetical protein